MLLAALVALIPVVSRATADVVEWFLDNPGWRVETVAGESALVYAGVAKAPQLRSHAYIGDNVVRVEYRPTAAGQAWLMLQARYPVALDGEPGAWHTVEARVRGPRYDEASSKTEHALILDVVRDGEVVASNVVFEKQVPESEFEWENGEGPTTIRAEGSGFAIKSFEVRRADFGAVRVPTESGGATNLEELVDFVALGRDQFKGLGCAECHAVTADDTAAKTGPNLFGLFQVNPREREIVRGGEGHRFVVKADRSYLFNAVRNAQDERAVAEVDGTGVSTGEAYLPIMPPYSPEILSDQQIEAIGFYLATLNLSQNQGPVERWLEETGPENYDPMEDRLQLLVDQRVRIQRGPMAEVSGRAIHVGQPNGTHYSFDPRVLGVARVWQGGFLNMSGEWRNRGGRGLAPGYESLKIDLGTAGVLLAPLNAAGAPIDFTFKDAVFNDKVARQASMNSAVDPLTMVAAVDAQFLGYERDSRDPRSAPIFKYRVGENTVETSTTFDVTGRVTATVAGRRRTTQSWRVNTEVWQQLEVSAGTLVDGVWTLPPGKRAATLTGEMALVSNPWRPKPSPFDDRRQALVTQPGTAEVSPGYAVEDYLAPKDNFGRDLLFEALGMAVAPDGTIVVATRTAGIWRLVKGEWRLFAEGLFDSLGVVVEDQKGLVVVAGQKAELTRISDTNRDGVADRYETLTDAFSYHGNYHSYMHGPVRDAAGDYFITLNLADGGDGTYHNAGGKYMGTAGGYRGWAARVSRDGVFEPWADGLRSPAGLGFAPDGRLWYADNQGEYMGTSKIFVVEQGKFYGHPAGLIDRPGMTPGSSEIAWGNVSETRERPVVLLPQSRLANSPGNPAWDLTRGKFGPFAGQMYIGDQTQSVLMRVATEVVNGQEQGVAIPFGRGLESGIMRPVFLPDGSLLLGQTGRGWQAKGGNITSLQLLRWDPAAKVAAIKTVSAAPGGFAIELTQPLPAMTTAAEVAAVLAVKSWTYRDAPDYGSPELDEHEETVTRVALSDNRRRVVVALGTTDRPSVHPQQTARVYQLTLDGIALFGESLAAGPGWNAFYTSYGFPTDPSVWHHNADGGEDSEIE